MQNRIVLEKKLRALSAIRFVTKISNSNEKSSYTLYNGSKFSESVKETMVAAFGEADIYITNALALKLGLRTEHSSILDKWNVATRLSLAYQLAKNSSAGFAYGIFYQNPERKYLPSGTVLDYSKATHYILQYQLLTGQQTFRTEMLYKKYDALYKTGYTTKGRELASQPKGSGYEKG